jgi:hypothetical protein
MSGQRESTLYGSSKHDSVMRWVLPCKIWNSVSMTSFQGAFLTGQRCHAWHQNFSSYISKDGLEDLTPHSFTRASKKFLCKLAQDLVTSFLHGKFAAALVDHSIFFGPLM